MQKVLTTLFSCSACGLFESTNKRRPEKTNEHYDSARDDRFDCRPDKDEQCRKAASRPSKIRMPIFKKLISSDLATVNPDGMHNLNRTGHDGKDGDEVIRLERFQRHFSNSKPRSTATRGDLGGKGCLRHLQRLLQMAKGKR
jgi:hypothetical protein